MKILCVGDICAKTGRETLRQVLPRLKKEKGIDLVIANGENSADGNGILPSSAESLFTSGVDVITGGNHTLRRREIFEQLEENPFLLRPANMPDSVPGKGYAVVDLGFTRVAVINLLGTVYMESMDDPFRKADELIKKAKEDGIKIIAVDFHAEATSEKRAMGFYLDSKVSFVFGTHTHVQTADEQILPLGTGYITDVGMTGPKDSVLGVKKELVIQKMKDKLPVRFLNAEGQGELSGCIFTVDNNSGLTLNLERVNILL